VSDCLQDISERRPSSERILTDLHRINEEKYERNFEKMLNIACVMERRDAKLQENKILEMEVTSS